MKYLLFIVVHVFEINLFGQNLEKQKVVIDLQIKHISN
jgi:hypothetical protein